MRVRRFAGMVDLGIMDISEMTVGKALELLEMIAGDGWRVEIQARGRMVYAVLTEILDWASVKQK